MLTQKEKEQINPSLEGMMSAAERTSKEQRENPLDSDHYDKILKRTKEKYRQEGKSETEIEELTKNIWTESRDRKWEKEREKALKEAKPRKTIHNLANTPYNNNLKLRVHRQNELMISNPDFTPDKALEEELEKALYGEK